MKVRKVLRDVVGDFEIKLEMIEGHAALHDYGLPRQTWRRGAKFMQRLGADRALRAIDERAERAANRGDYDTARRWRDVMAAIHAIETDERLPGDNKH
jgi:neutral trehalase